MAKISKMGDPPVFYEYLLTGVYPLPVLQTEITGSQTSEQLAKKFIRNLKNF